MDYLWTPWRFQYVSEEKNSDRCVFCQMAAFDASSDQEHLILYRGQFNFVLLNLYPYTTGHTMIAPYAHILDLAGVQTEVLNEMMTLAQHVQRALRDCYHPEGYNFGLNIGRCAGAGVEHHVHLHALPRWTGDSNFMTVVGETRVGPEELPTTYNKLIGFFRE